jgi:hypothetical protein
MRTALIFCLSFATVCFGQLSPLSPQYQAAFLKPVAGGGGCTGAAGTDFRDSGYLDDEIFLQGSGDSYLGTWMSSTATETVCEIELYLMRTGVASYNIRVEIWSYGGGIPTAMLTSSDNILTTSIDTSYSWVRFTGLTWNKVNGTQYVIVARRVDGSPTGSSYLQWRTANIGDQGHNTLWESTDGSSWTAMDIGDLEQGYFKSYK